MTEEQQLALALQMSMAGAMEEEEEEGEGTVGMDTSNAQVTTQACLVTEVIAAWCCTS